MSARSAISRRRPTGETHSLIDDHRLCDLHLQNPGHETAHDSGKLGRARYRAEIGSPMGHDILGCRLLEPWCNTGGVVLRFVGGQTANFTL